MFSHKKFQNTHYIQTASGDYLDVTHTGRAHITKNLQMENCLLIPKLSQKLLSVSHLTKNLNCTVLMTSHDCVIQDAQTGTIIGHGTERGGLYYVDEAPHQGLASLAHGSQEQQIWIWHRRLGHPSLNYLKKLFPPLSSSSMSLKCENLCFS